MKNVSKFKKNNLSWYSNGTCFCSSRIQNGVCIQKLASTSTLTVVVIPVVTAIVVIAIIIIFYCRHQHKKKIEEIRSARISRNLSSKKLRVQGRKLFDTALQDLQSANHSMVTNELGCRYTPYDEIDQIAEPFASGHYGEISRVKIYDDDSSWEYKEFKDSIALLVYFFSDQKKKLSRFVDFCQ